jgi:hypothetical protein
VTTTGEGRSNAGTSVMRSCSTTHVISGTPTSSPQASPDAADVGTLGFAARARWVVHWALGNHLLPDTAPDNPHGYLPTYGERTSTLALTATRTVPSATAPTQWRRASTIPGRRAGIPSPRSAHRRRDDFWAGAALSQEAQHIAHVGLVVHRPAAGRSRSVAVNPRHRRHDPVLWDGLRPMPDGAELPQAARRVRGDLLLRFPRPK